MLSGCYTLAHKEPIQPLIGPPIQDSSTPYSDALICIGKQANQMPQKITLAVDGIPDRTGKYNPYEEGYKVTQGADDMMISAIGKTNAYNLVERLNLNIPIMEIKYANDFLLSDSNPKNNIIDKQKRLARAIHSGVIRGSDYVVTGSINELNYNIDSGGFDAAVDNIGIGWRAFWIDVALDLRVVDTKTTQIMMVMPLRKQIWGYENKANVVRFFGQTYVDAFAGKTRQEPIQIAVRSIVEDAVYNMTKQLYKLPQKNSCDALLPKLAATKGNKI